MFPPSLSDSGRGCIAGLDCPQVGRQAGDAIDVTVPETSGPGQPLRARQGFYHKQQHTVGRETNGKDVRGGSSAVCQISYLGITYDLTVPETCAAGESFQVSATWLLPTAVRTSFWVTQGWRLSTLGAAFDRLVTVSSRRRSAPVA